MADEQPTPEPSSFDTAQHPRHGQTGRFVAHGDVDQAMRRIENGTQSRHAPLPEPAQPEHPADT